MKREHRGVVTQYDINKESGFIKEEITGKSYFFQYYIDKNRHKHRVLLKRSHSHAFTRMILSHSG
jgi:hypothetical protein